MTLPDGVNWEDSPLLDFSKRPSLTLLPDLIRLMVVGNLVSMYGGLLEENGHCRILDVAAGYGELYAYLQNNRKARGAKWEYVGLDVDDRKQARAQKQFPKIDYRLANFEIPGDVAAYSSHRVFDVVVSTETIEHLRKSDGERFIAECMEALSRPAGTFILTSPFTPFANSPGHLYEWGLAEMENFIHDKGWVIKDTFGLKGHTRAVRKYNSAWTQNRVPSTLLRALPTEAGEGDVAVFIIVWR